METQPFQYELLIIPAGLLIAWIFVFLQYKKNKKQFDNITSVERLSVDEVQQNFDHFFISYGAGTYQHYVEISGLVKSENPLLAPISGTPCVYYDFQIQRQYETQVQERDAQGKMVTRTRTATDTVASDRRSTAFKIVDQEMEIEILPESATLYPLKSHNSQPSRIDPELASKTGVSTYYSNGTTRGFSIVENIIPVGQSLYVLGEANDRPGRLVVSVPRDKNQSFILSTTHEDALTQQIASKLKWLRIGLWLLPLVAVIVTALFILRII